MDIDSNDSDAEEMRRLINYDKQDGGDDEIKNPNNETSEEDEDEDMDDYDEEGEAEQESEDEKEDEVMESDSDDSESNKRKKTGTKRTLKDRLKEEQAIRQKEKSMRSGDAQPKDIDDFERLLVANQDQSYLWIQYIAFMLDNIGVDGARKIAERAVKNVSISNEQDKLNIWTAFMNLESNFGSQTTLEACTKRALEVNERKAVYLNLIDIYKSSKSYKYIEPIFK